MMTYQEEKQAIRDAIALFPETFGLRAFPGKVFCIDEMSSYVSEGKVVLYTNVQRKDGTWGSWVKGSPDELRENIVKLA